MHKTNNFREHRIDIPANEPKFKAGLCDGVLSHSWIRPVKRLVGNTRVLLRLKLTGRKGSLRPLMICA
jgi:hypothetical protein